MKLLILIFILSLTLTPMFNAQTVDLDSRKIHIGDSFESVKKQFDPKIYKMITDSSGYPIYSYLYKYIDPKKGGGEESIAQLNFSNNLHSVQKYWDNGTVPQNGTNEFAKSLFGKDKIIYNDFPSEKEAEAKKNEFDMGYVMKNYLPPASRIVRFLNEQLTELPKLN